MATIDSGLARDSNGHHGVSVGDADGDGLDDLYVAQPAGLPKRLYRNRGDGTLDLYLCVYAFYYGAGEGKAGTPMPYHDARNGPPSILFRNDGHGHFVDVTREVGLEAGNDRYHFAAAWGDYDGDGWPDLLVANDFGRKNLYHNRGLRDGKVTFEEVSAQAGVEDYGAGMSAAFFDYDNDGRLDIYTGNMWSHNGQRITAQSAFMPDAPAEVRELYGRHARGNSLFRNL